MTIQQKKAWFSLMVCVAAIVAYTALMPVLGSSRAWGAFGILGLSGFSVLFSGRKSGGVQMDERDQQISRRAHLISLRIFWVCFVFASMIIWGVVTYVHEQDMVPADSLPKMVLGALLLFVSCHSIAILVQYRLGRAHEE